MTEMLSTNHKNVYVFKIIFHKTFLYIQIIHKNVIDKRCSKRPPPPNAYIFILWNLPCRRNWTGKKSKPEANVDFVIAILSTRRFADVNTWCKGQKKCKVSNIFHVFVVIMSAFSNEPLKDGNKGGFWKKGSGFPGRYPTGAAMVLRILETPLLMFSAGI